MRAAATTTWLSNGIPNGSSNPGTAAFKLVHTFVSLSRWHRTAPWHRVHRQYTVHPRRQQKQWYNAARQTTAMATAFWVVLIAWFFASAVPIVMSLWIAWRFTANKKYTGGCFENRLHVTTGVFGGEWPTKGTLRTYMVILAFALVVWNIAEVPQRVGDSAEFGLLAFVEPASNATYTVDSDTYNRRSTLQTYNFVSTTFKLAGFKWLFSHKLVSLANTVLALRISVLIVVLIVLAHAAVVVLYVVGWFTRKLPCTKAYFPTNAQRARHQRREADIPEQEMIRMRPRTVVRDASGRVQRSGGGRGRRAGGRRSGGDRSRSRSSHRSKRGRRHSSRDRRHRDYYVRADDVSTRAESSGESRDAPAYERV